MTIPLNGPARHWGPSLAVSLVLAFALAAPAARARSLTTHETAALAATVKSFEAALREGKFDRIPTMIPPKVAAAIARRTGMTLDEIRAAEVKSMQQFESFRFDLGKAVQKELAGGTPYVLIPTEAISAVRRGRRVRTGSHTLALLDDGKWYLLSIGSTQLETTLDAYPDLKGIEIPSGSTEILPQ
jgi:hypothetical protein